MEAGAVRVYENDMTEDFPVLKAFQQYIDAEQSKARKRLILLCMFFAGLMTILVAVFVLMIAQMNRDKQHANEQLIQFLMKDRDRQQQPQPVSVPRQDDAALKALADKLNDIQREFSAERKNAEQKEVKKVSPSAESLEIERLKALLSVEKEKAAIEREKQRQAELEDYRRKHYPELYEKKTPDVQKKSAWDRQRAVEEADQEIEDILKDVKAIDYFDDEDDEEEENEKKSTKKGTKAPARLSKPEPPSPSQQTEIPGDIKDAAGNSWKIPLE